MAEIYNNTILYKGTLKEILTLLCNGEDVTLSWMPDGGRTHIAHAFQEKSFLSTFLEEKKLEKIHMVYIDQSIGLRYIKEHIMVHLSNHAKYTDIKVGLYELIQQGHTFVFLIDNFHYDKKFFNFLNSLRSLSLRSIRFIFFILQSEFLVLENNYQNASSIIFHNIQPIGYLNNKESINWLKQRSRELRSKLSVDSFIRAAQFSGGVPSLLDACLRYCDKYKDFSKALESAEMKIIISKLWNRFSELEKEIMHKAYYKTLSESEKETSVAQYLVQYRVLETDFTARGGWLGYALNTRDELVIETTNDRLIIDGIDYTESFTDQEQEFLILLLSYDKLLYKDEVGDLLYADGDYSYWAIDKFISRLRKKLVSIGLKGEVIETVRGKGYRAGDLTQMKITHKRI